MRKRSVCPPVSKPVTVPYAEFGNPQSLNLYAYVGNNPLSLEDTDGHQFKYADGLQNEQRVRDTVQAILHNPNTSSYLSGYNGNDKPDLLIMSGDLSGKDTSVKNADGTITTTKVLGETDAGAQSDGNGGIMQGEASITLDDRNTPDSVVHTLVHESEHAGEANSNVAKFESDAKSEKSAPHDQRPQEQRAIAADKAYSKDILKAVKQIETTRAKVQNQDQDQEFNEDHDEFPEPRKL